MSKLIQVNGDDHPEAATKHLADASALISQGRPDGAAYLSGYVVECSLKSLHILETGVPPKRLHSISDLLSMVSAVATVAGAKTAKYLGPATRSVATLPISGWSTEMRYRAPGVTVAAANSWHENALAVFQETVHQMKLDGVI